MCGTAASCDGSTTAPTCDVANNQCICGTAGVETAGCLAGETCTAGVCLCGANPTCNGNAAADGCDDGTGLCTCGGNAFCVAPTPTCAAAACV